AGGVTNMTDNSIDPSVLAEFSSRDGDPIDEHGAAVHARAERALDELGIDASDEEAYLLAAETVADNIAAAAPRDVLARRLEAAEALADLTRTRLPVDASADDYVSEFQSVEEQFKL